MFFVYIKAEKNPEQKRIFEVALQSSDEGIRSLLDVSGVEQGGSEGSASAGTRAVETNGHGREETGAPAAGLEDASSSAEETLGNAGGSEAQGQGGATVNGKPNGDNPTGDNRTGGKPNDDETKVLYHTIVLLRHVSK